MQSAPSPLDILAEELGSAAGKIEREIRQGFEALSARFEARLAAMELAALKAENTRQERFAEVLGAVRNGKDGEPGKDGKNGADGKDADIEPLREAVAEFLNNAQDTVSLDLQNLRDAVESRLAEVKDGEPGPRGEPGKDGKMPVAKQWTNRVHYEGDIVRHAGSTYQALCDTGSEPPHGDWGELASRGTDGRGFTIRGSYDAAVQYRQHDVVMINRNSFVAKHDDPGECPGDGWQLFAASGGRGKEGPPGPKGKDGNSVSIAKWEADPEAMVLRLSDSTGKVHTLDLEPIAERILEAAR